MIERSGENHERRRREKRRKRKERKKREKRRKKEEVGENKSDGIGGERWREREVGNVWSGKRVGGCCIGVGFGCGCGVVGRVGMDGVGNFGD